MAAACGMTYGGHLYVYVVVHVLCMCVVCVLFVCVVCVCVCVLCVCCVYVLCVVCVVCVVCVCCVLTLCICGVYVRSVQDVQTQFAALYPQQPAKDSRKRPHGDTATTHHTPVQHYTPHKQASNPL